MKALFFSVMMTAALAGCNSGGSNNMQSDSAGINITPEMLAQKTDPVCGMDMTQTKIADTLTVDGKLYAFCNTGCKDEFKADPSKFLK